ncbi:DUF1749-domain-containing protein [Hesseltinella vesiculosa]|uniref:DUF1749-domain-containing protein n=1 Tax=Hesseltinella vesiculosa TaxID=101127 RepID=A0A1X2GLR1_9FUNG|nr:DUF1749-domain-containing protein [Hesseltinella vesiculosa]
MTSSYSGYGSVTLEDDSQEIDTLLDHLVTQRQKKKFVILGHSTGSQDCYWHNKNGKHREKVVAYILQAPVSDREFGEAAIPKFADQVALAKKMVDEHREQEWMSRSISDVPITATRYVALGDRLGQDDVFSGDLTEDELDRLYDGLTQPMMLVHGSEDEFYKSPVDQMELLERLQRACPAIQKIAVVSGGDHSLTDPTAAEAFVDLVISFLEPLL